MNIVISGYGRMGKLIHETALKRNHQIAALIDNEEDWVKQEDKIRAADVVIDFTLPDAILGIIHKCFEFNIPLVTGTTGWYHRINDIKENCINNKHTLFYAPNFSIGMNVLFMLNKYLSELMNNIPQYDISLHEVHHINKLDAPSGTAIKLAEDIINNLERKEKWINKKTQNDNELEIFSERIDNIIGIHRVIYTSNEDEISMIHQAKNRNGFALGALLAAEWVSKKTGFYSMEDLLKNLMHKI